jgi:hypothetical protein
MEDRVREAWQDVQEKGVRSVKISSPLSYRESTNQWNTCGYAHMKIHTLSKPQYCKLILNLNKRSTIYWYLKNPPREQKLKETGRTDRTSVKITEHILLTFSENLLRSKEFLVLKDISHDLLRITLKNSCRISSCLRSS